MLFFKNLFPATSAFAILCSSWSLQ